MARSYDNPTVVETGSLRVAARVAGVRSLGPGLRYALWVQGCPFACPGCIAPSFLPADGGCEMPISQIASEIVDMSDCNGLTLSGGEPFAQAGGLAELCRHVRRARPALDVIAFSGYRLAQLQKLARGSIGVRGLLAQIDVLIDGLYQHELNESVGMRGSSNQAVHFLTGKLVAHAQELNWGGRSTEEARTPDGVEMIVGVPTLEAWREVALLQQRHTRSDGQDHS